MKPLAVLALTAGSLLPAAPAGAAEPAGREPVVLVHGLFGAPGNFDTMSLRFRLNGYPRSHLVAFGYDSTGSLTTAASQFAAEVDKVRAATGAEKVDVVTHSLGGLPSRWYVKFLGGAAAVDDWISLGGPNLGGDPGTCPAPGSTACDQATKGSAFLTSSTAATRLRARFPTPRSLRPATPSSSRTGPDWTVRTTSTSAASATSTWSPTETSSTRCSPRSPADR